MFFKRTTGRGRRILVALARTPRPCLSPLLLRRFQRLEYRSRKARRKTRRLSISGRSQPCPARRAPAALSCAQRQRNRPLGCRCVPCSASLSRHCSIYSNSAGRQPCSGDARIDRRATLGARRGPLQSDRQRPEKVWTTRTSPTSSTPSRAPRAASPPRAAAQLAECLASATGPRSRARTRRRCAPRAGGPRGARRRRRDARPRGDALRGPREPRVRRRRAAVARGNRGRRRAAPQRAGARRRPSPSKRRRRRGFFAPGPPSKPPPSTTARRRPSSRAASRSSRLHHTAGGGPPGGARPAHAGPRARGRLLRRAARRRPRRRAARLRRRGRRRGARGARDG